MVLNHMSSLVFVGGEFPLTMFDERELFGGKLDAKDQLKIGPIGQFGYLEGKYRFEVTPDRVDLKCNAPDIVPEELIRAARSVANMLEPTRRLVRVSGFGMNCDTVFDKQQIGTTGAEFCLQLINPRAKELVEAPSILACERIRFKRDAMLFDVRIEPHFNSNGDNLLVAVNGHQEVSLENSLDSKLEQIGAFRKYVSAFHRRLTAASPTLVQH